MKAKWFGDVEDLTSDVLPHTYLTADDVRHVLTILGNVGYHIYREVELTGPMAEAMTQLEEGDKSDYVQHGRPVRELADGREGVGSPVDAFACATDPADDRVS